jgi:hypothetical protein
VRENDDEDLLRGVLRVGGVPEHAQCELVHVVAYRLEDGPRGFLVAARGRPKRSASSSWIMSVLMSLLETRVDGFVTVAPCQAWGTRLHGRSVSSSRPHP